MPMNEYGECEPESFKEFILTCEERAPEYQDYVLAALSAIIGTIFAVVLITVGSYVILYLMPKAIGHHWLQRKKQYRYKTDTRVYPIDYDGWKDFWPIEWKPIVAGYLIIFILVTGVVALTVGLYWFGHLVI